MSALKTRKRRRCEYGLPWLELLSPIEPKTRTQVEIDCVCGTAV
jgi:hypothetical protein